MVDNLTWRLAFYPSVPLAVITLLVIRRNLTDPPRADQARTDWLGAVLLGLGLTAVLLVTTWAGRTYSWGSPIIVSMIVGTVLAVLWFVRQEAKAPSPILPLHLFREREFSVTNTISLFTGAAFFLVFVYLPVFFQISLGVSATYSGLLLLPLFTASFVASVVSGRLVARYGRYKLVVITGTLLLGVGLLSMSTMSVSITTTTATGYMVVVGLSIGSLLPIFVLIIQNAVDHRHIGVATSSVQVFRQMGGSIGLALFGAVFNARLSSVLAADLSPDVATQGVRATDLISSPAAIEELPALVRTAIREAVAVSSGHMFRLAVAVAVAALVAALMLRELPLRDVLHFEQDGTQAQEPEVPGTTAWE